MAGCYLTLTSNELQQEIWKAIPTWEGLYDVSNMGRVRRVLHTCECCGHPCTKLLLLSLDTPGYYKIDLKEKPRRERMYVHQAVARAFIGKCPKGSVVNHKDANKINNKPSNLEYMTQGENLAHAKKLRLFPHGDNHPLRRCTSNERQKRTARKLDRTKVLKIRRGLKQGLTPTVLSRRFKISTQTIYGIKCNYLWKNVQLPN